MARPVLSVTITPGDIERATALLDKWQGAPLAKRVQKSIQAGLKLLLGPIKGGARRHHVTGATEASVKVRLLKKRSGEVAAYKVGIGTWYGHFPIAGVYGNPGDGYVDRSVKTYSGQVTKFIDDQITRLA